MEFEVLTPKKFPLNFSTVITIGSFDGIHLGHKKLFRKTIELAEKFSAVPVVVSFDPHPRKVLFPEAHFKFLTTLEEKIYLLHKEKIKKLVFIPFTMEVAGLSPEIFVQEYIVDGLRTKGVVVGFNFRFGKNRKGDTEVLKKYGEKYGFVVEKVDPVQINNYVVSSSLIRSLLEKGELELANKMLGHFYFLTGKVIEGAGRGRKLGFPTANLEISPEKLIPASGVYAVKVYLEKKEFHGVMNIGTKPTFMEKTLSVEVHIFDFCDNIYGKNIRVELIKFIREERKFSSIEELKKQITKDCKLARSILRR